MVVVAVDEGHVRVGVAQRACRGQAAEAAADHHDPAAPAVPRQAAPAVSFAAGPQPLEQVVADPQGIGHRRKRRVHRADAREEARVDHVEVVELVRAAVGVQHGRLRVGAEAAGAGLVGHARDRDGGLQVGVTREEMVRVHPGVSQQLLELVVQPLAASWFVCL